MTDIGRYAGELGALNFLALKADNAKLSVTIEDGPLAKPALWHLLELFEQAGLCAIQGHNLKFTDKNARSIANGGWLEMYTYMPSASI